ncbi:MAG: hypothetical protein A2536_06400 [Candidatus Firestonebacteria bacterium RIFOXYD2_FULL_39_29]|nr:MAG: hypothetical protein A2536_06400 [Candidatus Firestonebacteria bacterium RIFOXYD2_FULL_39_29]
MAKHKLTSLITEIEGYCWSINQIYYGWNDRVYKPRLNENLMGGIKGMEGNIGYLKNGGG